MAESNLVPIAPAVADVVADAVAAAVAAPPAATAAAAPTEEDQQEGGQSALATLAQAAAPNAGVPAPLGAAAAEAPADASDAADAAAAPPPAKRQRRSKKKGSDTDPDDLIDVMDNKSIMKRVPIKEGKGTLHPPWTWRTSVNKVREWRDLTMEQQKVEKDRWRELGPARQDALIHEVLVEHQSKSLMLIARAGKQPGAPAVAPTEHLRNARIEYEKAWTRRSKACREAEEAKIALEAAQRRFEASIVDERNTKQEIVVAERTLADAELAEPMPWNDMYAKLVDYRRRNGHVRVPTRKNKAADGAEGAEPELDKLAAWTLRNRAMYKHFRDPPENPDGSLKPVSIGSLTPHRIDALERLGFVWDTKEDNWRKMYEELRRYRNEHNHLRISLGTHPALYRWADRQKLQYVLLKRGEPSHLTPERMEALESIGFSWWNSTPTSSGLKSPDKSGEWMKYYQLLKEFRDKYGHCRVAHRRGAGSPEEVTDRVSWRLVQWVTWNRKQFKLWEQGQKEESKLTEERIRLLEEIGFEFHVNGRLMNPGSKPGAAEGEGEGEGGDEVVDFGAEEGHVKPATEAPAVEVGETPALEALAVEAPAVEAPAVEAGEGHVKPAAEAPALEVGETPALEALAVEAPAVEAGEAPKEEIHAISV